MVQDRIYEGSYERSNDLSDSIRGRVVFTSLKDLKSFSTGILFYVVIHS
jgi:hypothetical protein